MTKIEGAVVSAVSRIVGAPSAKSLGGLVLSGSMVVNDWLITMQDVEGGHVLTARRGTEVQTMFIRDGSGEAGNGGYYVPDVSDSGELTWTPSREGMPAVEPSNIVGPPGEPGQDGKDGAPGPQGEPGPAGPQGESGPKGEKGEPGKDGYTPVKGIDYFDGERGPQGEPGPAGSQGERGPKGADGYTPVKGVDYFDGERGPQGIPGEPGPKGDSGVHTGPDEPTDPEVKVWIDPDGYADLPVVTNINGKTGNVQLTAEDVGIKPEKKFELIEEITTSMNSSRIMLSKQNEPDGTHYSFEAIRIEVEGKNVTALPSLYVYQMNIGANSVSISETLSDAGSSPNRNEWKTYCLVRRDYGETSVFYADSGIDPSKQVNIKTHPSSFFSLSGMITQITIMIMNGVGDVTIRIKGVRA